MSNFGDILVVVRGARNAGVKHPTQPNLRVGGKYHPAHVNAAGAQVSARWTGSLGINHRGYKNPQTGQETQVPTDYIRVTAWTGKNSAGNGMAERFARFMSVGLELSCFCTMKPYMADQYVDNVRVCKADGTPIQTERMGFTIIPGSTIIGEESDKHIRDEIIALKRPKQWADKGHADYQTWLQICAAKNAAVYQPGAEYFGYSIVVPPKGAQTNIYQPQLNLNADVRVRNFTLDQWRASNPNFDEFALSNPEFAPFHAIIQAKRVAGNQAVPQLNIPTGQPTIVNQPAPGAFAAGSPY